MVNTTATRPDFEQAILSRLEKISGPDSRGEYKALCPFHNDSNRPNLSVNFVKGCYQCFACGSRGHITRLAQRLGIGDSVTIGKEGNRETPCHTEAKQVFPPKISHPAPVSQSLTLKELAEGKKLPVEFLRSLGVSDCKYRSQPAVRIPFYQNKVEVAVHFRLSLEAEPRFRWRTGDHPILYGWDRLTQIRQAGWVLVVEGESDCWTGWLYGLPVIGVPGKASWKSEWATYFKGLEVFVWQEPKAEDLPQRMGNELPDLKVIVSLEGIKDLSEAHIQGKNILAFIEELKQSAIPLQQQLQEERKSQTATLMNQAADVVASDDPLELVCHGIRNLGFGGDLTPALITYLAATSRLLVMRRGSMPVHLLLLGPVSCGKSYTLQTILKLLPQDVAYVVDAGSPHILIYDATEVRHKVIVFSEADSLPAGEDNPCASAIRNLLQDHSLCYKVTVKSEGGGYEVRDINRPGPAVLITTSTKLLGNQLDSRLFILEVPDDPSQIQAALSIQADLEISGVTKPSESLVAYQALLQTEAPFDIKVPYAQKMAEIIGKTASSGRILRDFARLLSLVKSVAILRNRHRQTIDGRLVAEIADYETVFNLVGPMYEATVGASQLVRHAVEAVAALEAAGVERVTVTKVAEHLGIGKKAASGRIKRAISEGWLNNTETRKGYPWALRVGEPMPERSGLPSPEELKGCFPVSLNTDASNGVASPISSVDVLEVT